MRIVQRAKLPHSLALLFWASLSVSVHADTRGVLTGYRNFTFGMTEVDLRKLVVVSASQERHGETWLEVEESPVIMGEEFSLEFLLVSGSLERISLSRWNEVSKKDCRLAFDRLVQEFSSQYGAADGEPETVGDDSRTIVDASFMFDDDSRIGISISASEFGCRRSVIFQSAKDEAEN